MRVLGRGRKALVHLLTAESGERWNRVRSRLEEAADDDLPNVYEDIAEFALELDDELRRDRILAELIAVARDTKDTETRADVIARLASMIATGPYSPGTPSFLDELIAAASKVRDEEKRVELLTGSVESVAVALAKSGEPWARERLQRLLSTARQLRSMENRIEFLTNLVGALDNATGSIEWAESFCGLVVEEIRTIRNVEARIEGLSDVGEALATLGPFPWQQRVFERMMDIAEGTGRKEERLVAVLEVAKAVGKGGAETLLQSFVKTKFQSLNEDTQAVVIGGLSEGLGAAKNLEIAGRCFLNLMEQVKGIKNAEARTTAAMGVLHGLTDRRSNVAGEPWTATLISEALQIAETIDEHVWRLALIAGRPIDVGMERTSVAAALNSLADSTWLSLFESARDGLGRLEPPVARLFGYCWLLEYGVGSETPAERLVSAPWLRQFYLSCIQRIGADLAAHGQDLDDDDDKRLHEFVAQRLRFLRHRLDVPDSTSLRVVENRSDLYQALLEVAPGFREEAYTENDVLSGDIRFTVSPRTAVLETVASDFWLANSEWALGFVGRLVLAVGSLSTSANREAVFGAAIEGLSLCPNRELAIECLRQVLRHTEHDSTVQPAATLSAVRAFVSLSAKDEAIAAALRISEPATRLQALRELAVVFREEVGHELTETLRQLVGTEGEIANLARGLGDPEYKDANPEQYLYDVAISFAGPDREHALSLKEALSARGLRVFYYPDPSRQADLWGEDGYRKLYEIFNSQALYCLVLLSKHYVDRKWTLHELRAAQARQLESKEPYILPIRLDDSRLPGEAPTRIYLTLEEQSYVEIAGMVAARVLKRRLGR